MVQYSLCNITTHLPPTNTNKNFISNEPQIICATAIVLCAMTLNGATSALASLCNDLLYSDCRIQDAKAMSSLMGSVGVLQHLLI